MFLILNFVVFMKMERFILEFSTAVLQLIPSTGEKLPEYISALAEYSNGEGNFFLFQYFSFLTSLSLFKNVLWQMI